jgi:L-ribulose-5-phosphate 3-epimerase
VSAVTDEIATTPADAIQFARQYGLRLLELRNVPGQKIHYAKLPEADLQAAAREFREDGLKVSFLNTGFYKFALPGTEAVRKRTETPEERDKRIEREKMTFDNRLDEVRKAARAAQILGVNQMRVFTFARVAEPAKIEQRIADVIGEMAEVAGREKVRLLIENEGSCNVGTSAELASMLKLLPSKWVGLNWDPLNGVGLKETPYPNGYALLPKKRIGNVQLKGHSLLDPARKLDWPAIFAALERDGYKGNVGLETHYFDGTMMEKSHLSMKEILRIVES